MNKMPLFLLVIFTLLSGCSVEESGNIGYRVASFAGYLSIIVAVLAVVATILYLFLNKDTKNRNP
ncbi:hypothetical protein FNH22_16790 [Fulvivirga sp. M361]|uniref:hypothetical protein n=1 Tax=Fulvivirga sp. M361 TaxID=2594266 RepID=UPI001179FB58|nr:hypothetical protein [Fulvivirga sp. M361]TRX56295.1 hypothetical protein FNH22_16790 [Fulvivirga sp. M361]